jgi:hypothetical protein
MKTLLYLVPNGLKYGHKRDLKALQRSSGTSKSTYKDIQERELEPKEGEKQS